MHLAGAHYQLLGNALGPLQYGMHLGRSTLLTLLRPVVGRQRQLAQTGIAKRNTRELLPQTFHCPPIALQHPHPRLHHLLHRALSQGIREGIKGHRPLHHRLQRLVFFHCPHQSPHKAALKQLKGHQKPQKPLSCKGCATRLIGITIKDDLHGHSLKGLQKHRHKCDRLEHANPPCRLCFACAIIPGAREDSHLLTGNSYGTALTVNHLSAQEQPLAHSSPRRHETVQPPPPESAPHTASPSPAACSSSSILLRQ